MQEFKFRGVDINTGEFVYAELDEIIIADRHDILGITKNNGFFYVDASTLARLVGYDSDGREVYEGDILVDAFGNEFTARLHPMGVNDDDCIDLADSAKLNLKLKETDDHEAD